MDNRLICRMTLFVWLTTALVTCEVAQAGFFFGRPQNLGPTVNSSSDEASSSISADGLSLYFASNRPGGSGEYDLWVCTRATTSAPWGPATNLGAQVNSPYSEMDPSISPDGLSLYFSDPHNQMGFGRRRPDGLAPGDGGNVWVATRTTVDDPWSAPVNLGPDFNTRMYDQVVHPSISGDGLSLYVHACARGIGIATRASTAEPFGPPVLLQIPGAHAGNDWWPGISADERVLFVTVWSWGTMDFDLWMTTRPTADSEFGLMTPLPPEINYPQSYAMCPSVSADGSTIYFCSMQPGGLGGGDLWQAPILPVVDFNGDYKVDIQDLLRMIDSWGQDDPSLDIGPMPWGDGMVDDQDLEALMCYWGQEVQDDTLLAHWKFDETEGQCAPDSEGDHDGTIVGMPAWHPGGGYVDGALEFDGTSLVVAKFVLNPADGPFSVLAWVKGGAPGQVIVSQQAGYDWLVLDPATGSLMTELRSGGRQSKVLCSDAVTTGGNWHRVGFTWDGSNRRLYVDDILVAEDTDVALAACDGGLNIGCGKLMTPTSFFTGLIDEVRIYNRAVRP